MTIFKNISVFLTGGLFFVSSSLAIIDLSNARANDVIVQSDGKIVIAGSVNAGGVTQTLVARYSSAGALDNTFNGGAVTTIIGDSSVFNGVLQQSDGKIVAVGSAMLSLDPQFIAVRFNTNGTLDTTFGNQGIVTAVLGIGYNSAANAIAQQSDGKLVFAGTSATVAGVVRFFTARLNGNGTLDTTFGTGGAVFTANGNLAVATNVLIQPSDQKIVVTGYGTGTFLAMRYTTTGTLDSTFGSSGVFSNIFANNVTQSFSSVLQSNGSIVMGGFANNNFGLMRCTSAGVLDTSYNGTGLVTVAFAAPASIYSLVLQSDGNVVAVGYMDNQLALARITSSGTLDTSYGTGGQVTAQIGSMARGLGAALQPSNGKVVVAGYSAPNLFVTRYNTNGSVDGDFGVVTTPLTCSTALCAYGQVYNLGAQDPLNNQSFTFDSNGILNGISHSTTSNTQNIIINQAGTYLVNYFIEASAPAVIQLLQNGSAVPAASFTSQGSAIAVGRAIINASAGDTLSLINLSGYDIFLVGGGGINASIDLEKIA